MKGASQQPLAPTDALAHVIRAYHPTAKLPDEAVYDRPAQGGNGDDVIDSRAAIFSALRLRQDANHNGVSEPGELRTRPARDVSAIHLDYHEARRTDQYGNQFRYRAQVGDARHARVGRWAWDVFFVRAP